MKILSQNPSAIREVRPTGGFTLVETMIAVTIMTLFVIGGVMSANFVGLREDQLMETKAGASDTSRRAVNQLLYNIRSSKGFDIGNLSNGTNFLLITNGALQGPALKLYPVAMYTNQVIDPNRYLLYYFDASQSTNNDNGILWVMDSSVGQATVVASNLIAPLYFTVENYQGYTQAMRSYKSIIHTTLQYSQFLYPITMVGSNGLYSSYRIDCRATPHIPDGQ